MKHTKKLLAVALVAGLAGSALAQEISGGATTVTNPIPDSMFRVVSQAMLDAEACRKLCSFVALI